MASVLLSIAFATTATATTISTASKPTPVPRTAGGDIPDTATYLRFHSRFYSIEYVEGWVQRGLPGAGIRVSDISSYEMVTVQARPTQPLMTYVRGQGKGRSTSEYHHLTRVSMAAVSLPAGSSVRLTFRALSSPNPVTGKKVTLLIDRYYVPGRRHMAVITLATPVGVDNVDAFRRIARSFTWIKP